MRLQEMQNSETPAPSGQAHTKARHELIYCVFGSRPERSAREKEALGGMSFGADSVTLDLMRSPKW